MQEFADSKETRGVKLFFYLRNGLSILNEGKNLIMFLFAAYFALKLTSWIWLVLMFLGSLPILIIIGWLCVHRWNKILEWLSIRYGTHYQIRNFQIQEEILEEIKKLNYAETLSSAKIGSSDENIES